MIEEELSAEGLDFGALRFAIEKRDPDLLLGFYAEAVELRIVNAAFPEGVAFELRGRSQIERYLHAVSNQEMSCSVEGEIFFGEEGSIEFEEACEYPDGTGVVVRTKLELREGRITHQLDMVERRSGGDDQEVSPGNSGST